MIERSFGTLQDRLVKEMRLRNISKIETANNFLEEYLPVFNSKFNVIPFDNTDVNIKIGSDVNLNSYLCVKKQRVVKNDNTISYNTKIYQLKPIVRAKTVTVEEHMDDSMHISYNGVYLDYKEIMQRPSKSAKKVIVSKKKKYIPPPDHPWRQTFKNYFQPKLSQRADEN